MNGKDAERGCGIGRNHPGKADPTFAIPGMWYPLSPSRPNLVVRAKPAFEVAQHNGQELNQSVGSRGGVKDGP